LSIDYSRAVSEASRLAAVCGDLAAAGQSGAAGHRLARERFSVDAFAGRFEAVYHDRIWHSENRP